MLVLAHGTCPKSRKIISESPDVFLDLQMSCAKTKISHIHEPRSGRFWWHLLSHQLPWTFSPHLGRHVVGSKWACVCWRPFLCFVYYNLGVALFTVRKQRGLERKKKKVKIRTVSCTLLENQERISLLFHFLSIMGFSRFVVQLNKGMLTGRASLNPEAPSASRFRISRFRMSQIPDKWLSAGPRWELTPWPGRAGIKEMTRPEQKHRCCRKWWCVCL